MRRRRCSPSIKEAIAILLILAASTGRADGQTIPDLRLPEAAGQAREGERDLQLEVLINDAPVNLISSFRQRCDASLTMRPEDLRAIGLRLVEEAIGPDGRVVLDRLPGVACHVDDAAQVVRITASDEARLPRILDLGSPQPREFGRPQASYGGVLNYTLFNAFDGESFLSGFDSFSAALDGRIFSPYGVLSQSMISTPGPTGRRALTRLETTYSYSDMHRLVTYRAGDLISGGLDWTRPIRLGGVQAQRNFALRPDLITLPVPQISGSAAVPSTLEIYTRNMRAFAGEIPAGPYEITNLPIVTGAGTARVVVRDALGRETVTILPFYTSNQLLRRGLYSFSAEAGFARRSFGARSNDYGRGLLGSASLRYGLSDRLTLEAHAEGGSGLVNGGSGAAFSLGTLGVASLAAAGSHSRERTGAFVNASLELSYLGLSLYLRSQRTFDQYEDLASVTAAPAPLPVDEACPRCLPFADARMPKAQDQVTLGMPLPFARSSLSLTYTLQESATGERNQTASAFWSGSFPGDSTIHVSAFKDFDEKRSYGLFAGISVPLGRNITASGGVESGPRQGRRFVAEASKSEQREIGSWGWRVHLAEGRDPDRLAAASYHASFGRIEGTVQQVGGSRRATAQLDGSIATAGGGVFFADRINDAFAVVDVGAPKVPVRHENRPVGVSGSRGLLLVPYLYSYQKNLLSIDPTNLPVDAEVASVRKIVVPADRSGVVVDFGVSEDPRAALVTFVDSAGTPLEMSSEGRVEEADQSFVVGYDGQAYIRGLDARNKVEIVGPDGGSCRAEFGYTPRRGEQVVIRNIVCR